MKLKNQNSLNQQKNQYSRNVSHRRYIKILVAELNEKGEDTLIKVNSELEVLIEFKRA